MITKLREITSVYVPESQGSLTACHARLSRRLAYSRSSEKVRAQTSCYPAFALANLTSHLALQVAHMPPETTPPCHTRPSITLSTWPLDWEQLPKYSTPLAPVTEGQLSQYAFTLGPYLLGPGSRPRTRCLSGLGAQIEYIEDQWRPGYTGLHQSAQDPIISSQYTLGNLVGLLPPKQVDNHSGSRVVRTVKWTHFTSRKIKPCTLKGM